MSRVQQTTFNGDDRPERNDANYAPTPAPDRREGLTLTIDTKKLRRAIVAALLRQTDETAEQLADMIWAEYARLSSDHDAEFDRPVLDEDPAPTWKGGLLGTDHGG